MHPGDKECEEKFKEAQEAYAVLSDPEKRRQYDQFGHAAFDGGAGGAGGFDFSGMDMGDIFGDIFGDFFGGGRRNSNNNGPAQGASVRLTVRITFEEAVFGCSKELEFPYKEECKTCHGTGAKPGTSPETCSKCGGKGKVVYSQQSLFGMMQNVQTCPDCGGTGKVIREKCPDCRGTGYISKKVRKTVEIPAGIDNGQSVRVRGYGEPGRNGGPRGDLLVEVVVSRHPILQRQGMDVSRIDPETLLSLYSIVFQDVTLFDNTILENIRIGNKDATDEQVIAAAKLANVDEFAEKLPDGWHTNIGENGCELSGGERQRISIARAFLKNAPIILLDEATASLDVENETLIQTALSRLIADKTVLVIAHRMRTVAGADKIVVLSDGTVAEEGSPKDLEEKNGVYAHMVKLQTESQNWKLG